MRFLTLLLLAPVLALTGCAPAEEPLEFGDVQGKLTLNGAPLPNAMVVFNRPESGHGGSAVVDGEGKYIVTDKLPVGSYQVVISPAPVKPPNPGEPAPTIPPNKIPAKYSNPASSGLTAEVAPGENTLDFDLK